MYAALTFILQELAVKEPAQRRGIIGDEVRSHF